MTRIATHIRIFAADPSDEMVDKRTTAIGEVAHVLKERRDVGQLLRFANDLAAAVQQGGKLSAGLTEIIEGAIRKSSTAFVAEGHELEMLVYGMSAAVQAVTGATALRHGAVSITDVLSFGLWSGLSFQKPRTELKLEQLRSQLMRAAQDHCAAVARDSRRRIQVPDPEFKEAPKKKEGEPAPPFDTAAAREGLKPFKDSIADLRANAAIDREEIDLLWWVLSDWSLLLGRRLSDCRGKGAAAAVASGFEVGRMLRRAPSEAHRHLVLRNVEGGKDMSLLELVAALGGDRAALTPDGIETFVSNCPAVFPLITALRGGAAADTHAKIKRPISDWAARALLESSIEHLLSNLPTVSV